MVALYKSTWFWLFYNKHFQHFYPRYNVGLMTLVNTTCAGEYANYQYYVNHDDCHKHNFPLAVPAAIQSIVG